MEALHANELPFINGGEHIEGVPEIPIWLSLTVILGVLVIATVASLLKTRGQLPDADEPAVDADTAGSVPTGSGVGRGAEARIADEQDEDRARR